MPRASAVQIDFDARLSERPFYSALLREVRRRVRPPLRVSMTALASWCADDPWIEPGVVDEIVPMLFQMGPDARRIVTRLQENRRWPVEACNAARGVSTDEPWRGCRRPPPPTSGAGAMPCGCAGTDALVRQAGSAAVKGIMVTDRAPDIRTSGRDDGGRDADDRQRHAIARRHARWPAARSSTSRCSRRPTAPETPGVRAGPTRHHPADLRAALSAGGVADALKGKPADRRGTAGLSWRAAQPTPAPIRCRQWLDARAHGAGVPGLPETPQPVRDAHRPGHVCVHSELRRLGV